MSIGKVVILAGGLGSRLSEETDVRPKPMVEIAGRPILWHIMKIYSRHGLNDTLATITAVQPPGRFGVLDIDDEDLVTSFREKPQTDGGWINGGFMVLSPKVLDYIAGDATPFESEPLANLAGDNQLG